MGRWYCGTVVLWCVVCVWVLWWSVVEVRWVCGYLRSLHWGKWKLATPLSLLTPACEDATLYYNLYPVLSCYHIHVPTTHYTPTTLLHVGIPHIVKISQGKEEIWYITQQSCFPLPLSVRGNSERLTLLFFPNISPPERRPSACLTTLTLHEDLHRCVGGGGVGRAWRAWMRYVW